MTALDVYLEGVVEPIGKLKSAPNEEVSFVYTTCDLPHPISVSLPAREEPFGDVATRGFFSNLLFENEMRNQVMEKHGISAGDIIGLLYHLGADCPGSISCVPEGAGPVKRPGLLAEDYEPLVGSPQVPEALSEAEEPLDVSDDLARIMTSLRDNRRLPPESEDPSPLAGVQGKIAVTRLHDGRLALPGKKSGAPTTHILKVPRANQMQSVRQEHHATRLMARIQKHETVRTCIIGEGDLQGLLVERFDRRTEDGKVYRVHQEDFCQALGLGHILKYERNGEPGRIFDAHAIGRLMDATLQPGKARIAFFEITLANMLLGNSDNHAKNHALLYTGQKPVLAPAYDIDPVLLNDSVTHEMSFRIGCARMADDVGAEDLDLFLKAIGAKGFVRPLARRCTEIIETAIAHAENLPPPSAKQLSAVIRQQAHHLSANAGFEIDVPEFDNMPVNRPGAAD
ncbi:HipA domain-containing protein [Paracoccus sp. Z330]|uniref:HipA domain-containing protein n=1 Tax=Paracoccus onchidii TaxID=3017813 RepID=A0ABT4ZEC0_9RHOB|nr:HipA domain-containing protein [Paracoccus onchidii]MDB6177697.1 HipA domain-containing protein [Paracoccus onchidii]